jgi:phosphoribosyl 1,2-cyclic phosphodiesterase
VKLTFLGTRGYIEPSSRRHRMHTATLVEHHGRRVLIDCGETWRSRLATLRAHAVVLTHAHPDHASGLDRGAPCPVYATRATWTGIEQLPIDPELRRILHPRRRHGIEGITFEPFPVVHSLRAPAVGYRIEAGPVAVFYVPDVVEIPNRSAAFHRIRAYVGDGATITRNMVRRARPGGRRFGHASIRTQLEWCRRERVPEMIVTHCGSDIVGHDEAAAIARIRALAEARGVEVTVAHDGMTRLLR